MKYTAIKFLLVSFCLSLLPNQLKAQNIDIQKYRDILKPTPKRIYSEAKGNKNEISALFSGLFLGYKNFISSQDQNTCSFTPSCSEFGILAVKRFGMVKGGVLTMDRLTRCNGLSPEKYEIDKTTKLLIDKPEGNEKQGFVFQDQ